MSIRFYMKQGRWHVIAGGKVVPAQAWWDAINQVKCLNHQLRLKARSKPCATPSP